jgi:vacuolar-type H+-ATPase subunit F/Vma7
MEGKVAVLGNSDFVMPFAAMGLDTYATEAQPEKVIETAQMILKKHYALVVMSENVARSAQTVFEETQKNATPCVVVVPFTTEPSGVATESLGRMLMMATGINILKN